jgi:hypothetical protein
MPSDKAAGLFSHVDAEAEADDMTESESKFILASDQKNRSRLSTSVAPPSQQMARPDMRL